MKQNIKLGLLFLRKLSVLAITAFCLTNPLQNEFLFGEVIIETETDYVDKETLRKIAAFGGNGGTFQERYRAFTSDNESTEEASCQQTEEPLVPAPIICYYKRNDDGSISCSTNKDGMIEDVDAKCTIEKDECIPLKQAVKTSFIDVVVKGIDQGSNYEITCEGPECKRVPKGNKFSCLEGVSGIDFQGIADNKYRISVAAKGLYCSPPYEDVSCPAKVEVNCTKNPPPLWEELSRNSGACIKYYLGRLTNVCNPYLPQAVPIYPIFTTPISEDSQSNQNENGGNNNPNNNGGDKTNPYKDPNEPNTNPNPPKPYVTPILGRR